MHTETSHNAITRADGCCFVLRPFREHITSRSRRDLLRQLKERANRRGDYCHVQRLSTHEFDIAVHDSAGQLLGEAIARHFEHSADLVWCEVAGDETTTEPDTPVLIVVVRDGKVKMDRLLPLRELSAELTLALSTDEPRKIS